MNRLFSKTTVLVALAAVLFSCKNDDKSDELNVIDANKEFANKKYSERLELKIHLHHQRCRHVFPVRNNQWSILERNRYPDD